MFFYKSFIIFCVEVLYMLDLFFDLLALLFVLMVSVLGVFKTSLMLEELKMLRSYCTHSYGVLQQKNTDQNQITEKAHGARSRRSQAQASSFPLPVENIQTEAQRKKNSTKEQ